MNSKVTRKHSSLHLRNSTVNLSSGCVVNLANTVSIPMNSMAEWHQPVVARSAGVAGHGKTRGGGQGQKAWRGGMGPGGRGKGHRRVGD